MTTYRSLLSTAGAALACAAALAPAAPALADGKPTVRCVGGSDFCTATVGIADGANDKAVTVRLTDPDLRLVKVTALNALDEEPYAIDDASTRHHGSQFHFTLDAPKANPKGARLVLQFAAGRRLPLQAPSLLRSWRTQQATFNVGKGMKVSIQGGGAKTSNCSRDETNETFTTTGDGDRHTYGFYSVGSGSCFYEMSWSNFVITVKDPSGAVIGSGTMSYGQGTTYGDYNARCDDPWSKGWKGNVTCDLTNGQITIDRIY
ncbi:MAG TPA: hypothetical protein VGM91_17625 [Conexibacter sp.]|jgi:hypothetical protein